MITTGLAVIVGIAIMAIIWAVVHNRKNHPGKIEGQISDYEQKIKDALGKKE